MYFHVYLIYRFTRTFTDHSSVITRCWVFELQNGQSSLKSLQTLAAQSFAPASFLSTHSMKNLQSIRVMFIGTQVDTISCKGADSVCCPLSCFFLYFFMREAGIPHSGAAQCAAAPRPAPSRCLLCRCRGTRCGCSGGSCGSISPSARPPRSSG